MIPRIRLAAASFAVLTPLLLDAEPLRASEDPAPPRAATTERRSVCPVCRVREGTAAPEPVRATRERNGVSIGFCSRACAVEFDRRPELYLAAADSVARVESPGEVDSRNGADFPDTTSLEGGSGAFSGVSITPT